MSSLPDLAIIIVNWRSVDFLERCLSSILANTGSVNCEIVVVDNASYDGSQEMVGRKYPQVTFIQNQRNEGFAKANNLALLCSTAPLVLFLNPDTEILGQSLAAMVHFMDSTPDAGIVGPKLLNSDSSVQITSILQFPSILNEAVGTEYIRLRFPNCPLWDISPLFTKAGAEGLVVEAISGACMMVRRNVFEQIGMFTTDYFMFSEDLDLCYKAREAGWKTYHFGRALVMHHGGRSTAAHPDSFQPVMIHEAHTRFLLIRHGKASAARYKVGMATVAAARMLVLGVVLGITFGRVRRQRLSSSLVKWWSIFRWAVGPRTRAEGYLKQDLGSTGSDKPTGTSGIDSVGSAAQTSQTRKPKSLAGI